MVFYSMAGKKTAQLPLCYSKTFKRAAIRKKGAQGAKFHVGSPLHFSFANGLASSRNIPFLFCFFA